MRVFVTGASGHIGKALVAELLGAGHQVVGLARSDGSAAALDALGVEVFRGDLDDPDGLARAASSADAVAHLAYRHDLMQTGDMVGAAAADLAVVQAIGAALAGTGKPFTIASGTLLLAFAGLARVGTEADALPGGPRIDSENAVIALAERDVRSSAVRLPPTVHSDLDEHGFVPTLIDIARRTGVAGYVGDGANRWPAVHTLDAARLFRLALEAAPAGSRLHAVDDEGVPFRDIAEAIGHRLGVPAAAEAPEHFRPLAMMVGLDNPTSSARTRELLGWTPTHPRLLEDLDKGHYFDRSAS
jgi:nucleoside-diphosphate-sugar epimerase